MLRLSLWRLGGAVSRASAAAAASVKQRRSATPRRIASPPRSATSSSRKKVVKRHATPVSARGRPTSAGRGRASSSSPTAAGRGRGRGGRGGDSGAKKTVKPASRAASPAEAPAKAPPLVVAESESGDAPAASYSASTRPRGMSAEREKQVLDAAMRMQGKDVTTEVPVASFAYMILTAHPIVRSMGLRERMDFLLRRWNRLSKAQKLEYVNDPLRGLL